MSLDEQFIRIQHLLNEEQRIPAVAGKEIALRRKERNELKREIDDLVRVIRLQVTKFRQLPQLPEPIQMRWAQNVLACPHAGILTVDVDTSMGDAVPLRIHLLDLSEATLFDQMIAPGYILSQHTLRMWGITPHDLQNALPITHIWDSLLTVLLGRYVVSYDLERVRTLLEAYAHHYELEPPVILGESLTPHLLPYFRASGYSGLSALCQHIGFPLPEPPDRTIFDRARGQLSLLHAMAQGRAVSGNLSSFHDPEHSHDMEEITFEE